MRASVLLVGDDLALLRKRAELLQDLAQIRPVISGDAEAAIFEEPYDLVIVCHSVVEQVVRRLLTVAWMLFPSPAILVSAGSEEHRRLGAVAYHAQLGDPQRLHSVVAALTMSTGTEYGFLVRFRSPKQTLYYVAASTVEIQGDHLVFVNSKGRLAASFVMDLVCSWNVLSQA
jgi:hypothetical protein